MVKKAVIIGAGPAGLTAAYELLTKSDIKPVIFEKSPDIGGISKTLNFKGNRIDIGGHRFYSKSDKVVDWWLKIMPLQGKPSSDDVLLKRHILLSRAPNAPDPESSDLVMLFRHRISRIFFLRKFFDYPISLTPETLKNLGLGRVFKIAASYMMACLFPIKKETSLEDFFVNRFGRELYATFFESYTEKVWGVKCSEIKPEWGAQRVKGLSVKKAVLAAAGKLFGAGRAGHGKNIETSLIEQFMYPKFGPGQLWETVADKIRELGGEIRLNTEVTALELVDNKIEKVTVSDRINGQVSEMQSDFVFSSMPVPELISGIGEPVPYDVMSIAQGLKFRDFLTVGVLLRKLKVSNTTKIKTLNGLIPDNWIYVQEKDVSMGRIQVFNNWSPYLVKNPDTVWLGLEYFCNKGDDLWKRSDDDIKEFALKELEKIGFSDREDYLDGVVLRMEKTYPAYFGSYPRFDVIRKFTDQIDNLFLVGRNGMHRYNNADHSMLTAMTAVENIISGIKTKDNIWAVNTETDYHEAKKA